MSKINLLKIFLFLLLIPLFQADTTFFDSPDDFFIIKNSPTGNGVVTGGATAGEGIIFGGSVCKYGWNCTNWSECLLDGKQIRNCTNIGTCSDEYRTPKIEQNCVYTDDKVGGDENLGNKTEKEIGKKVFTSIIVLLIIGIISLIIFYQKKSFFKNLKTFYSLLRRQPTKTL